MTLPESPPWAGLSQDGAARLVSAGKLVQVPRGPAPEMAAGLVLNGVLAIAAETADGRRTLCQLYHAGDLVDRVGENRDGRLEALSETQVLVCRDGAMERLLRQDLEIASVWISQFRAQAERLRRHCLDIASKTPSERLAAALTELRGRPGVAEPRPNGSRLRLPILYADIAEYLGVQPETVSRAFRQLAADGAIEIEERGAVRVIDDDALGRIAKGGRPRASRNA